MGKPYGHIDKLWPLSLPILSLRCPNLAEIIEGAISTRDKFWFCSFRQDGTRSYLIFSKLAPLKQQTMFQNFIGLLTSIPSTNVPFLRSSGGSAGDRNDASIGTSLMIIFLFQWYK